jgi:hypothetical protein
MVDICGCRSRGNGDYFINCEFPGNKSGVGKSGEKLENGMKKAISF